MKANLTGFVFFISKNFEHQKRLTDAVSLERDRL